MLIIFHVAPEATNTEYPYDAGPNATAPASMSMIVENLINKFGPPTKIFISPYNVALKTYLIVKHLFDKHKVPQASRDPHLGKFISNKISKPQLMPKTLDAFKASGFNYLETDEEFKKRVRQCYTTYLTQANVEGSNVWLLTHTEVLEYVSVLAKRKFAKKVDYHAYLAIPSKGDILASRVGAASRSIQSIPNAEMAMPLISIASSSVAPPMLEPPKIAKPSSSNYMMDNKKNRREIKKTKRRNRREDRILKNAIVPIPKKSRFLFDYSSSESESSSDSDSDYSSSSSDSDLDFISTRASDVISSQVGGNYRPQSSRGFQKSRLPSAIRSPYNPDVFEPKDIMSRYTERRRNNRRGDGGGRQPNFDDLSRFGEEYESEFLRDGDLESIM